MPGGYILKFRQPAPGRFIPHERMYQTIPVHCLQNGRYLTYLAANIVQIFFAFLLNRPARKPPRHGERLTFRIFRMRPLMKPVIDRRLAKMTERRITDVVHPGGPFPRYFQRDRSAYPDRTPPAGLLFQAA